MDGVADERGLNLKVWRLGPCQCEGNGEYCLVGAEPIALFLALSQTDSKCFSDAMSIAH